MRGEDHVAVEALDAPRENLDERLVVVPALDEDELCAVLQRVLEPLPIAGDRQPRVVRGEDEANDPLGSAGQRRLDRLGDPGLPPMRR